MSLNFSNRIEKAATRAIFAFLRIFIHVRKVSTIPRNSVRSILVIRQHNQFGDMLCVIPFLRSLRHTYPDAFIAMLAKPLNSQALMGSPYLNEVIVYDKSKFIRAPFKVWRFGRSLRKRKFDLAIVPSPVSMSVTSDVIAFFSGARRRIGPASLMGKKNLTGYLYNVQVPLAWSQTDAVHQTQRNIDIAKILVLDTVSLELELGLTEDEIREGAEFLASKRGGRELVVGFHPGAAKPANRWDALRFAEIANRCAEILGAFLVISAGKNDAEPAGEMMLNVPNDYAKVDNPIRFLASVIRQCDLFISNDTGIMHLSAAVGTPTLSLFGPTDPLQWAPIGQQHRFILGQGNLMDAITVEKVWSVTKEMLKR